MLRALLFLAVAVPGMAFARPVVLIVGSVGSGGASDRPVFALRGERVRLYAVLRLRRRGRVVFYSDASRLRIGGRRIPRRRIRPFSSLPHVRFHWSRVEPRPHHLQTPPPNRGNAAYSNAVLFGPRHGKWIGYDTLEYHETPISGGAVSMISLHRVKPSHPKVDVHGGLGTMHYRVYLRTEALALASAGADPVMVRGLPRTVMRVSFHDGDDLVGKLSAYYNVPNVFGSGGRLATHQTERFQGADCADVIVGAMRLAGARVPYTSAAGLRRYARPVSPKLLLDKTGIFRLLSGGRRQVVKLRFGVDVRRGDIMLIDYLGFSGSSRGWDHVGVVAGDAGIRGVFDPKDPLMHMGYLFGLTRTPARSEGPAIVQFLRLNAALRRAIARRARWLQRLRMRRERRGRRAARSVQPRI